MQFSPKGPSLSHSFVILYHALKKRRKNRDKKKQKKKGKQKIRQRYNANMKFYTNHVYGFFSFNVTNYKIIHNYTDIGK